jgi:hypothetical protein
MADEQLAAMVRALLSPDNTLRNQAETAFNGVKSSQPSFLIRGLMAMLRADQDQQVRPPRLAATCPRAAPLLATH